MILSNLPRVPAGPLSVDACHERAPQERRFYSGRPTFAGQAAPCGAEEGTGSMEAAVAGSALTGAAAEAAFAVLVAGGLAEATGFFRFEGLSSA
jgi:hypothetical protein